MRTTRPPLLLVLLLLLVLVLVPVLALVLVLVLLLSLPLRLPSGLQIASPTTPTWATAGTIRLPSSARRTA